MLYEKVLEIGNASFTDTSNLKHEHWLELRRTGIGGSDAGAIMGLNKYATPLSVYLAKKDLSSFDGNAATEWGHILEEPIRQKAREELGVEIVAVPGMFTSKDFAFMNANLDGIINAGDGVAVGEQTVSGIGGHEIKTSARGEGFADDEIPDSYYCQVQHYMAVTGLKWFILTAFFLNSRTGRHYVILRNDDFISVLIKQEKSFWQDFVLADIAPSPTGNENELELIKALPMPEEVELGGECEQWLNEKELIDKQIKKLQADSDIIKERILMRISAASNGENAERTTAFAGDWKITYNTQTSKRVDTNALKKAGIYDAYARESVSRVLRIQSKRDKHGLFSIQENHN